MSYVILYYVYLTILHIESIDNPVPATIVAPKNWIRLDTSLLS